MALPDELPPYCLPDKGFFDAELYAAILAGRSAFLYQTENVGTTTGFPENVIEAMLSLSTENVEDAFDTRPWNQP